MTLSSIEAIYYIVAITPLWILFHELGHYLVARSLGLTAKIKFPLNLRYLAEVRIPINQAKISKTKLYLVAIGGLFGFIPVLPCFKDSTFFISLGLICLAYCILELISNKKQIKNATEIMAFIDIGI